MVKNLRPVLSRRSMLAGATGLAAAAAGSNYAHADDLPDAADAINSFAPMRAPDLAFTDATGRRLRLSDYHGSGLIVDIWATWCGPCVAELPTLAAIAPRLALGKILVLPVSIDQEGAAAVRPFYASHRITSLPILLDPDGDALDVLNTPGIPATILINPKGQFVATAAGSANWDTPATLRAIQQLIGMAAPATDGFQPV